MAALWCNYGLFLALAFSLGAQGIEGYTAESASEAVQQLESFQFSESSAVGGVAVVLFDGQIAFGRLGNLRGKERPNTIAQKPFRAGSVSKLITALLAGRLVDDSMLSWNDEIDGPDNDWFRNPWMDRPVTLAQLFEHTAGLEGSDYRDFGQWPPDISARDYIERRKPFVLRWKPGLHYSYANSGAVFAARSMELVSGNDFDSLVEQEVFAPLGMKDSTFLFEGEPLSNKSVPLRNNETDPWFPGVRAAGNLVTTLEDLSQVVLMLLRGGMGPDGRVFIDFATIERMERSETSLASGGGAGEAAYGIGQFPFVIDRRVFRGHWGRIDGFQTTLGYCRETGRGFVVWTDSASRFDMGKLRSAIAAVLKTPDSAERIRETSRSRNWRSDFDGIYRNFTHDMKVRTGLFGLLSAIRVESTEQGLAIRGVWPWNAGESSWIAEGEEVFRRQGFPLATGTLAVEGTDRFWVDGESWMRVSSARFWSESAALFLGFFSLFLGGVLFPLRVFWNAIQSVVRRRASLFDENAMIRYWASITLASWVGLLFLLSFVSWGIFGGTGEMAKLARPTPEALLLAGCSVIGPLFSFGLLVFWKRFGVFQRAIVLCQTIFWLELALLGLVPLFSWT